MKRSKTQLLRSLAAVMLLGAGLASCSQDDLADNRQGEPLPPGEYPLTLTASVDGMKTRSAGKDGWTGDDTEYIGVRIGNDGIPAKYVIGSGNSVNPATDAQTLYWQNTTPATVTAWYPYEAQTDVNISNQKDGFADFDFLTATEEGADYKSSVTLHFQHQMAKVKYTLIKHESITDEEFNGATVQIAGFTQVSFKDGVLEGTTDGWITPTTSDNEALLVPQKMTDRQFIKVTVGKNASEREFYYIPTTDAAGILTAGKVNTYNITVKRTGLEVSEISASWNDDETQGDAQEPVFRVYMPTGHGQNLTYSSNVMQQSGYLEVKGTPFTISYNVTGNDLQKGFPIAEGIGTVVRQINGSHDTYTFTYTLRSDVRLDYTGYAEIGDYYYSDGTWLPYHNNNKTCIGIVFKSGAGNSDHASNYGNKLTDNTIHGYVVALQDAHAEAGAWGIRTTDETLDNENNYTDKYNGYTNTLAIQALDKYTTTDIIQPTANGQYWAFRVASEYNVVTVPANSSGWYLPSIAQLQDIYNLNSRSTLFTTAGGTDFITETNDGRYWSSTEKNNYDAWYFQFNGNGSGAYAKSNDGGPYLKPSFVRAVLTF